MTTIGKQPIPPQKLEIGVLKKDGWLQQLANKYDKNKDTWIDESEMSAFQKAAEAEDKKREEEFYKQHTKDGYYEPVYYNSEYRSIFGDPNHRVEPLPPAKPQDGKKLFEPL